MENILGLRHGQIMIAIHQNQFRSDPTQYTGIGTRSPDLSTSNHTYFHDTAFR